MPVNEQHRNRSIIRHGTEEDRNVEEMVVCVGSTINRAAG